MPTSVAIRLGIEGGAEVKRVLTETGQEGQAAFQKIGAASDAAGAAVDRQTARYQRLAEAARQAEAQARAQANVNSLLGVGQGSSGSARDSASVFELQARAAEEAARRADALGREMDALRNRYDPLAAAAAKYAAALADIARGEETGALSASRAAEARLKETRAYEDATQKIERMGAAQKASAQGAVNRQTIVPDRGADVAAYGSELDRLRAKYSPLFAAQREYLSQLAEVRQAVRTGALTQQEGANAVQATKDAFAKQVGGLRGVGGSRQISEEYRSQILTNIALQGKDAFEQILAGGSPVRAALMQVPQAASIAAAGGMGAGDVISGLGQKVTGLASGAAAAVRSIGLLGGAFGITAAAAVAAGAAYLTYTSRQKEVAQALAGIGQASGATVSSINAAARSSASAGNVSVATAREMATTFASTGRIGDEVFGGLIKRTKDYALVTGQDVGDATKELAQAFADPARGADTLNAKLGLLSDAARENVQRLQAQGNLVGAQRALYDALSGSLSRAADLTTAWGRISTEVGTTVSNIFERVGRTVEKSFGGGTLEQQLAQAQKLLAEAESSRARYGSVFGVLAGNEAERLRGVVAGVQGQIAGRNSRSEQVARNQRSIEIGEVRRRYEPEQAALKELLDSATKLRAAISDPIKSGLNAQQFAETEAVFGRISRLARTTAEDIQRFGSVAAADQLRQSEFGNRVATERLNPVDRSLAERRQQFEREIRAKGIDPNGPSSTSIQADYDRKASSADPRDLAGLAAARDAALRNAAERETLARSLNLDTDTIKKEAEVRAERSQNVSAYMQRVVLAESGGDQSARNTRSSATGLGQFIDDTWLRLFKQQFPDRASGMSREEILGRRTDRSDSIELIRAFTEENSRALEKAGLATTDRNLYLAHFAGAQGAVDLLRADPGASAQSILGARAAAANPTIIGGGRTAQDVIDYAGRTIAKNAPNVRATDRDVAVLRSQTTLTDQTAEAEARRQKIQELLNDEIERGTAIGRSFATAQDLVKASSSSLTPEMEAERKVILDTADAYAKAQAGFENSRLGRDVLFERAQLGRTQQDQSVASRLRGTGLGLDGPEAEALRLNDNLRQTKDLATGAFSGMLTDLRRGTGFMSALSTAAGNLADRLLSLAADKAVSSLFGSALGGSGGGLLGMLGLGGGSSSASGGSAGQMIGNEVWFKDGGYTGHGGRLEAAGIVHRGEVVWSQADVRRWGGAGIVDAMRRGERGYEAGGIVGASEFRPPSWMATPANAAPAPIVNVTNNAAGDGYTATAKAGPNGSVDVLIDRMDKALAGRQGAGRSAFGTAAGLTPRLRG